jgi:hypothetical protein
MLHLPPTSNTTAYRSAQSLLDESQQGLTSAGSYLLCSREEIAVEL